MKFSIVLLAASILKAQANEAELDIGCYTKTDCKLLGFMKEAIESGKGAECESKGDLEEATICRLEAFGLTKDQAELNLKVFPYTSQCTPESDAEFYTCRVGCTKQSDKDSCLESCALPLKIKFEECLSKLAGLSTENSSESAKCVMSCDNNSYSEIFDCGYKCHKEVFDTFASKNSDKNEDIKVSDKLDVESEQNSASGESKLAL